MTKTYSVVIFDQDGFPVLKNESVLIKQEKNLENNDFLLIHNSNGDKFIKLKLIDGQPKFNNNLNTPFVSYRLLNNFTITIKTEK